MKIISNDNEFWDIDKITQIRLDMANEKNILSFTLKDSTTRTVELTQKEMRETIIRTMAAKTKRRIDTEDCDKCKDKVCEQDPKQCRFWPRDKSEYLHEECYYKNDNPVPMCSACPRFEKRLQVCTCRIHPCTICEE